MEVSIMCVDLQSLLHLNSGLQLVTAFSCPGRKGGIHHKIIYIYIYRVTFWDAKAIEFGAPVILLI